MKNLAVFDFDHTVIDGNSDTIVRDILPAEKFPHSLKQLHTKDGWTAYMQGVFDHLYKNGIRKEDITNTIKNIKPVEGMCELINFLKHELSYDIIIISDANTYFIDTWLREFSLLSSIEKVFTNPACFTDNMLKIDMYHLQTECNLSTKNLCKGKILQEYLDFQREREVSYDRIVYVGDGYYDLCPILRLKESDLACVRSEYKCANLVKSLQAKKPIDKTGKIYEIKSDVLFWKSGCDILSYIKDKFML